MNTPYFFAFFFEFIILQLLTSLAGYFRFLSASVQD